MKEEEEEGRKNTCFEKQNSPNYVLALVFLVWKKFISRLFKKNRTFLAKK